MNLTPELAVKLRSERDAIAEQRSRVIGPRHQYDYGHTRTSDPVLAERLDRESARLQWLLLAAQNGGLKPQCIARPVYSATLGGQLLGYTDAPDDTEGYWTVWAAGQHLNFKGLREANIHPSRDDEQAVFGNVVRGFIVVAEAQ